MAQAALGSAGLHFDELNKLRVLDPDVAQQTAQLREECKAFVDSECCAPSRAGGRSASIRVALTAPNARAHCATWGQSGASLSLRERSSPVVLFWVLRDCFSFQK